MISRKNPHLPIKKPPSHHTNRPPETITDHISDHGEEEASPEINLNQTLVTSTGGKTREPTTDGGTIDDSTTAATAAYLAAENDDFTRFLGRTPPTVKPHRRLGGNTGGLSPSRKHSKRSERNSDGVCSSTDHWNSSNNCSDFSNSYTHGTRNPETKSQNLRNIQTLPQTTTE